MALAKTALDGLHKFLYTYVHTEPLESEQMSFPIPTVDHPARALIDLHHLADVLAPQNAGKLLTILQARRLAEAAFTADTTGAMRRVTYVVVRADTDERWLVSFGRRRGWRKEWNFGTGRN